MKKYVDKNITCRNCSHQRQFHMMYTQIAEGYNLSKYAFVLENIPCMEAAHNGVGLCNCNDFQSSDNLEYLENKYYERQKDK